MSTADRPSSASAWFLSAVERGNPDTTVGRDEPWTEGNAIALLIHGSTYFSRLLEVLTTLGAGDRVL